MATPIKSMSPAALRDAFKQAGIPSFRADQVLSWLYVHGVASYDEMTNISKPMREQLAEAYPLYTPETAFQQCSRDGSRKYLLKFPDGAYVETVGLPSNDGRLTVCLSSQSGCGMNCAFCATGKQGLTRNLEPGEIVDQVLVVQNEFKKKVTNIVVMGQGEPFTNFHNTVDALRLLNNSKLLNIGARHITVSTCGIIPRINDFAELPEQFTLAISLHSARQKTRNLIMPALSRYPLHDLRNALQRYTEKTGRRYSLEYALMEGINDSKAELSSLISFCQGQLCHVNLIPLNSIETSAFQPSSRTVMNTWNETLQSSGIASSIRKSRGSDIDAACGQLASKGR